MDAEDNSFTFKRIRKKKRKKKSNNKKKLLWAEIQSEFTKYNYKITTEALDKKFRNLKKKRI